MKDELIELRGGNFVRPSYVIAIRTVPRFTHNKEIYTPAQIYVDLKNNVSINILCSDDADMLSCAKEIRKMIK